MAVISHDGHDKDKEVPLTKLITKLHKLGRAERKALLETMRM